MGDAQLSLNEGVKATLLQTNETFRQLVSEHQELDQQIRGLTRLSHRSAQQHYEEVSLKKRKLALKDRIEAMVRGEHRTRTTS